MVGAGTDTSEFTEKECGEGTDRSDLNPCGVQLELLAALKAAGKPLVTVLIEGRPLAVDRILALSDAVLIAFYPGEAGGTAIADILFGRINPSGKLPVSIPFSTGQLPVAYSASNDRHGRYYLDGPAFAALEFGFGLSYTTFEYSCLKVRDLEVEVTLANTGSREGVEIAQFYLTAEGSRLQRPWRELCCFERCRLQAGESKILRFRLTDEMLYWLDRNGKRMRDAKEFTLQAGGSLHSGIRTMFHI